MKDWGSDVTQRLESRPHGARAAVRAARARGVGAVAAAATIRVECLSAGARVFVACILVERQRRGTKGCRRVRAMVDAVGGLAELLAGIHASRMRSANIKTFQKICRIRVPAQPQAMYATRWIDTIATMRR